MRRCIGGSRIVRSKLPCERRNGLPRWGTERRCRTVSRSRIACPTPTPRCERRSRPSPSGSRRPAWTVRLHQEVAAVKRGSLAGGGGGGGAGGPELRRGRGGLGAGGGGGGAERARW